MFDPVRKQQRSETGPDKKEKGCVKTTDDEEESEPQARKHKHSMQHVHHFSVYYQDKMDMTEEDTQSPHKNDPKVQGYQT
jgi:hypothetical protein